jgi:hypothetical protein
VRKFQLVKKEMLAGFWKLTMKVCALVSARSNSKTIALTKAPQHHQQRLIDLP